MDDKKIRLRNSGSTVTGLVMTLLLVMAMFFAGFAYLSEHGTSSGVTLDDKYSDINIELQSQQSDLGNISEDIRSSVDKVVEADNTFETAWNGLKGLGNTLKLPLQMTSTTFGVWAAFTTYTDFIPSWLIGLALIGVVTFVVLLILKVLKGEPAV